MGVKKQIAIVKGLVGSIRQIDYCQSGVQEAFDLTQSGFEAGGGAPVRIERNARIWVAARPARNNRDMDILAREAQGECTKRIRAKPGVNENGMSYLTAAEKLVEVSDDAHLPPDASWKPLILSH